MYGLSAVHAGFVMQVIRRRTERRNTNLRQRRQQQAIHELGITAVTRGLDLTCPLPKPRTNDASPMMTSTELYYEPLPSVGHMRCMLHVFSCPLELR